MKIAKTHFDKGGNKLLKWRTHSDKDIEESEEVLNIASMIMKHGIKKMDSLHLACAIKVNTDYFLTTDNGIIKKTKYIKSIQIVDPIGFSTLIFAGIIFGAVFQYLSPTFSFDILYAKPCGYEAEKPNDFLFYILSYSKDTVLC